MGGLDSERDRLVEEHLGLAKALARRFANRGEPYDDLVQVACLALVKAVDGFDPARGYAFSSYATPTIIGELKHHLRDRAWHVKAPRRLQNLYLEVTRSASTLTHELGRSPTIRELASYCSYTEVQIIAALEAGRGYRADSFDQSGSEPQHAGELTLGSPVEQFEEADELTGNLRRLPAREQEIIRLRFFEERSQLEIAARLGISQVHVSRLLHRALEDLRGRYES